MAAAKGFEKVTVVEHPVIAHKLTELRDKSTRPERFRDLLRDVSSLLAAEATRDLPLAPRDVETNLATTTGAVVAVQTVVVPVLRAGLGMSAAVRDVLPDALVGFIGMYRDGETHEPVEYYAKVPPAENGHYFVVDPMFATGGTATAAVDLLNRNGIVDENITFLALIAAPEGLTRFRHSHTPASRYTLPRSTSA